MLRALGWSRADVRTLIAAQAFGIGVCAAILMAGAVLAATAATGAGIEAAAPAIAAGTASGIGSTLIAAAVPGAGGQAGTGLDAPREEGPGARRLTHRWNAQNAPRHLTPAA